MLVRKTVTVLFCDVVTSTEVGGRLDPESWQRVMSRYFAEMERVIVRHGGTTEKFIGDAIMAVFGVPVVHEDDALRAVRAAWEMRERLDGLNDELQATRGVRLEARIGVNTGEVVAGDPTTGSTFVTGETVNVAKRLEQAAEPGTVLIGATTYPLVRDAVRAARVEAFTVKGVLQPVTPFVLEHVEPEAAGLARRLDTPLVGRFGELARLRAVLDAAVEERSCELCTVLGAPGIGKSRLAAEALALVGPDATAVSGRCLPYGDGITFWPLREIVHGLDLDAVLADTDDAEGIAARIRGAVGTEEAAGSAEETFWAVRRLFEALAGRHPLVVWFEDIHWAEPTFLDLIEYLAGWLRGGPVVLLCLARPELLEVRPSWTTPRPNMTIVSLDPLSERESEELLGNLGGDTALAEPARSKIAAAAEGNPLFVEQMLAMVSEQPDVDPQLDVPPSIQALLAERLDRLADAERAVIERASVVGREFPRGAVRELAPPELRDGVGTHLLALVRKGLVEPETSRYAQQDGFRFRHSLIRDAAYERIPKEVRADLHARFADWMERHTVDRAVELEEIRGYHLEQAYRLRQELGPLDEATRELGRSAAQLLGSAGRRAFARGDMPAAVRLLERTLGLLPPRDPAALALLPDLGVALKEAGDLGRAEQVLTDAIAGAAASGDRRVELNALIERAALRLLSAPEGQTRELLDLVENAIPTLEELGDDRALATAWYLVGLTGGLWRGRFAAGEEALERALGHAREAGDRRQAGAILAWLAFAALNGPTRVPDAIARCEALLDEFKGDHIVEAGALRSLSTLEAKRGRFDEARELIGRARTIYEDLGMPLSAVAATTFACGRLELLADDHGAAERRLREGYEELARMGEKGYLASVAALLAEALYGQGRYQEAERFTETVAAAAASDDISAQIHLRATRAKLLAQREQLDEAASLAREALALAETTDALDLHGDVLLDLAQVLRGAGRRDEAADCVREALRLYELKGNVVSAEKARALLGTAVGV